MLLSALSLVVLILFIITPFSELHPSIITVRSVLHSSLSTTRSSLLFQLFVPLSLHHSSFRTSPLCHHSLSPLLPSVITLRSILYSSFSIQSLYHHFTPLSILHPRSARHPTIIKTGLLVHPSFNHSSIIKPLFSVLIGFYFNV